MPRKVTTDRKIFYKTRRRTQVFTLVKDFIHLKNIRMMKPILGKFLRVSNFSTIKDVKLILTILDLDDIIK